MIDGGDDDVRARRGRRVRGVPRAITIRDERTPRRILNEIRAASADRDALPPRPTTRAECAAVERPCPFVSCRHHLYLEVHPETGAIKLNRPDLQPWEMSTSCSLDIADDGPQTLELISRLLNLTRERVRQIERRALITSRRSRVIRGLAA